MAFVLSYGATILNLAQGPEWGGESSVELALTWEAMTDGRWRVWDRGRSRDTWSCRHTWRIPKEIAADLYTLVQASARGQGCQLLDTEGAYPFGPLISASPSLTVRVSASQDLAMRPVNQDWLVELSIVPDPHPFNQGLWLDYVAANGLDDFLAVADASPAQSPAWGVQRTETSWFAQSASGDMFTASLRAKLPGIKFRAALAKLVDLRGGIINIPGERMPWGPGVAPNDSGTHRARPKAFSWSRLAPDLWELSVTAVQEPV